jgi:acyl-CoA synthetase (AMP-forming)/AMP-acid ligase II
LNLKYIKRNETFGQILRDLATEHPDREAIVYQNQRVRFGELLVHVDEMAKGFQALGVKRGDNVCIILPNCPEYMFVVGALAYIGAAAVPMSVQTGSLDMAHILKDSEAVAVVMVRKAYGTDLVQLLDEVRTDLTHLKYVVIKEGDDVGENHSEGFISLSSMLISGADLASIEPVDDPSTPAMILYTSGTTGAPKGAVHTHRTLLMGIHLMISRLMEGMDPSWGLLTSTLKTIKTIRRIPWLIELIQATKDKKQIKLLLLTPMYHIAGYFQILLVLLTGGKVVIMDRFHPHKALELIQDERITLIFGVPPQFRAMITQPDFENYDVSSIVISVTGAMSVPPQVIKDMKSKIGGFVTIVYGTTEIIGGSITWASDPEEKQSLSVGHTSSMGDLDFKIVDDDRRELQPGAVGEIVIRTPMVMDRYYNLPEATAAAKDEDGWYYTGDLGMIDEGGYVHVMGRRGDMIIRAGANIYPAEIEHLLLCHPEIEHAAVIGTPGEGGEKVTAYIVPKGNTILEIGDIIRYCRGKIAAYKIPEQVVFVEDLPVTPAMQKVKHYELRNRAIMAQKGANK